VDGGKINLVHRPVGMFGHHLRVGSDGSIEIGDKPIHIIDSFNWRFVRVEVGPKSEDGGTPTERFDIMPDQPKPMPDFLGHSGLAPKVGAWEV
jgi:hypothetical protein